MPVELEIFPASCMASCARPTACRARDAVAKAGRVAPHDPPVGGSRAAGVERRRGTAVFRGRRQPLGKGMKHGCSLGVVFQQMLYDTLDHSDDIVLVLEQTGDAADESSCFGQRRVLPHLRPKPRGTDRRTLASLAAPDGDPSRCAEIVRAVHEHSSLQVGDVVQPPGGPPFWLGFHLMPVRDVAPPCFVDPGSRHHREPADPPAAGSDPGPARQGLPVRQGTGGHRRPTPASSR